MMFSRLLLQAEGCLDVVERESGHIRLDMMQERRPEWEVRNLRPRKNPSRSILMLMLMMVMVVAKSCHHETAVEGVCHMCNSVDLFIPKNKYANCFSEYQNSNHAKPCNINAKHRMFLKTVRQSWKPADNQKNLA